MSEQEKPVKEAEDFEVTELDDGDLEDVAGGRAAAFEDANDNCNCNNDNCECAE